MGEVEQHYDNPGAVAMIDERAGRQTLPVWRSFLAPEALAETVGAAYDLDEPRCRLIKATIRDVYRVDARQGPFVLIVYRHGRRSAEEIEAELDVLDELAAYDSAADSSAAHVHVAPALRTALGARLLPLATPEGVRHAALFPFVEGIPLERSPQPELARRYGRLVARVHDLTDTWLTTASRAAVRPPLDAGLLVERSLASTEGFLGERQADLAELRWVGALLTRRLAGLPTEPPGYGLIHGDVIPTNLLVGPEGRLTLLDFDFCGPGWRAFDVATFLHAVRDERATEAAGSAFLAGYQESRPLADWELASIPLFVAVRDLFRLGNWGWRVEEWGTQALSKETLAQHLAQIRQAVGRLG